MRSSLTVTIVLLFVALPIMAERPRPFSARDLVAMERISDPQVSPDGEWIAFGAWQDGDGGHVYRTRSNGRGDAS